jgi:transcriptional regulator with XRE-family HTH domain
MWVPIYSSVATISGRDPEGRAGIRDTFIHIRKRLGLTQEQLARKLGVHRATVTNWERGAAGIPGPVARLVRRLDADRKAKNRTR